MHVQYVALIVTLNSSVEMDVYLRQDDIVEIAEKACLLSENVV